MSKPQALVVNGWYIFAHPLFIDQYEDLLQQVQKYQKKDPVKYREKNATKRLAAITELAFEKIPHDPSKPEYRLGTTLGEEYKHWFRAKFFQQYRLVFRYHLKNKIIVYAWVNDEETKRAYNNKLDAYLVFKKILARGYPPDDWDSLLKEAKTESKRLTKININRLDNDCSKELKS